MTAEPQLPELNDSTFHMLRCVVAVAAADNLIRSQELLFLNNLLAHYRKTALITTAHVDRLQADLRAQQPIDALLAHVTERPDREQLVLFAGLMAQSDGEVHPAEEELVRKIHAYCTRTAANDKTAVAPSAALPDFDMRDFKKEIRSIVQQEFYKKTLAASGVAPRMGAVAITDAFTERNDQRPRRTSYEMIIQDAGRHRAAGRGEMPEPALPKTDFDFKALLKLAIAPAFLWLLSTQANMLASIFTYHQITQLGHWGIAPHTRALMYDILSSPRWGTVPASFLRDWAGILLLWRLWALWMSGRMSPMMRKSIVPGEAVLGKARFHFIYIAHPVLWAGILWVLSFKVNMFLSEYTYHLMLYLSRHGSLSGPPYDMAMWLLARPGWGAVPAQIMRWSAAFIVLHRLLTAWITEIVVTDSRLLFCQGIATVRTLKIDITNLQQVNVNQSWLGLILDYGYIDILTNNWSGKGSEIGVSGISLPPVADPHAFSTLVDRARRMWRKGQV